MECKLYKNNKEAFIMNITKTRVKQYNSTYKTVISVDGIPICMTKADKRASEIIAYLNGYDANIADGKIKKILDNIIKYSSYKKNGEFQN